MFDVSNVNLHFGERHVLRDASFKVDDGERAAIIGPNGAGKSTLLKIIAGAITPETGSVSIPGNYEIGFLPQEVIIESDLTVEAECRTVFQDVLDHETEMRGLETKMADATDHESAEYQKIVERYDFLMHETMRRDIYSIDANIGKVLSGLGFTAEDLQRPCRDFSGGWQMRIALGKILLSNPDVLLLDEPTNHLDIESIEWLSNWLSNHDGSILMVSHERAFMDALVNKVVEIDRGKIVVYRGNYSESLQKRDERREMQQREYTNQQQEIAQTQRFIDRFRYQASKASMVQSRIKHLEKLERIEAPETDQATISFSFPPAPRSGKEVLVTEGLAKQFDDNLVFQNATLKLYRGEKVALVGVNGAGKSTLMSIMADRLDSTAGTVTMGSNVAMEYFAQYDRDDLHPSNSVFEEYIAKAPADMADKARSILGAFLFSGDDIDKKVSVLSGGEKTRLRLARMLSGKSNLLLLDEPTNHLDIGSRLTLERALREYDGAVVLVSHDRYFLDAVVTRVVEIDRGKVTNYPGNYEDYLHFKGIQDSNGPTPSVTVPEVVEKASESKNNNSSPNEKPKLTREERKALNKELNKAKKQVEALEDQMMEWEERIRDLENDLADPAHASDAAKLSELSESLTNAREKMESTETSWTEEQERVEELEAQLTEE